MGEFAGWNYRVVVMRDEQGEYLEIREVYYEKDGTPAGHCETDILRSEDEEGLHRMIENLQDSLSQPILKFNEC